MGDNRSLYLFPSLPDVPLSLSLSLQGKGEMATYWLEGRDGLQLQELTTDLQGEVGEEQTNPAYMHMVEELNDSPENQVKGLEVKK